MMTQRQVTGDTFWSSDLEDIEAVFLGNKTKVTDLPVKLNNNVPPQGSVLLNRTMNIDERLAKKSWWDKFKSLL